MSARIWRFGAFELDEARAELRKEGRRIRLKPQPLMVLAALVEGRGSLVTRDELKKMLWADQPAYRTDENLNHAVKRLREALGDSGSNPRFVATVRNRGYRFVADVSASELAASHPPNVRRLPSKARWMLYATGGAGAAALLVLLASSASRDSAGRDGAPVVRATVSLEAELRLGSAPNLAISPDGRTIAYAAGPNLDRAQLYVRELASERARIVPGTEGARVPFFSPDGTRLGFYSRPHRALMEVALSGGMPTPFGMHQVEEMPMPLGASWMMDGDVVLAMSPTSGLLRLRPDGRMEALTVPDRGKSEKGHRLPDALPNGKGILFTVGMVDITSFDDAAIAVVDVQTRETRVLVEGATCGRYSPSGHIVYWRGGSLYAVPFDQDLLRVTGPSRLVQDRVVAPPYAAVPFAVSRTGTLVFAPGPPWFRTSRLYWVDRGGRAVPVETGGVPETGEIANVSFSPRGDRVAFSVGGATDDIWVLDVPRASTSRLTFEWDNIFPAWAPDGRRLAFWSNRGGGDGIFVKDVESGQAPELLVASPHRVWPTSWSADGRRLLFMELQDGRDWDLRIVDFDDGGRTETFLSTPFNEGWGLFSPSGRRVAYESDESGRFEIYVRAYDASETKSLVSTHGGIRPRWTPDGSELFYWEGDRLMTVELAERGGELTLGTPKPLFENAVRVKHYDVATDGERIVIADTEAPPAAPTELTLVLNWAGWLKLSEPAQSADAAE